jgi:hypothetical protein
MTSVASGTELMRPFMPAKDFELSKRFYEALGFEKVLDGEVAIFNAGSGGFILQRYFQEDWAKNFMMQLMVDDLDMWWAHIESLDLTKRASVCPRRNLRLCSPGAFVSHMWWIPPESFGISHSDGKTRDKINE